VTHGTDRAIWAYREPAMQPFEQEIATAWIDRIAEEVHAVEAAGTASKDPLDVLTLRADKTIGWDKDDRWDELMRLLEALPGETVPEKKLLGA